jgi:hypothetical protein
VILSNIRRTRTVPSRAVPERTALHSISSYQTQTAPNYFYNKTRVQGVESNHRTTMKNLELFLKIKVFLKKKRKIMRILRYFKYLKILIILWYLFKKILV